MGQIENVKGKPQVSRAEFFNLRELLVSEGDTTEVVVKHRGIRRHSTADIASRSH
jgi:hypothetical protein